MVATDASFSKLVDTVISAARVAQDGDVSEQVPGAGGWLGGGGGSSVIIDCRGLVGGVPPDGEPDSSDSRDRGMLTIGVVAPHSPARSRARWRVCVR